MEVPKRVRGAEGAVIFRAERARKAIATPARQYRAQKRKARSRDGARCHLRDGMKPKVGSGRRGSRRSRRHVVTTELTVYVIRIMLAAMVPRHAAIHPRHRWFAYMLMRAFAFIAAFLPPPAITLPAALRCRYARGVARHNRIILAGNRWSRRRDGLLDGATCLRYSRYATHDMLIDIAHAFVRYCSTRHVSHTVIVAFFLRRVTR